MRSRFAILQQDISAAKIRRIFAEGFFCQLPPAIPPRKTPGISSNPVARKRIRVRVPRSPPAIQSVVSTPPDLFLAARAGLNPSSNPRWHQYHATANPKHPDATPAAIRPHKTPTSICTCRFKLRFLSRNGSRLDFFPQQHDEKLKTLQITLSTFAPTWARELLRVRARNHPQRAQNPRA